ncbi:hypothetical protein ACSSS7_003788 [Eimeria intestinalis]
MRNGLWSRVLEKKTGFSSESRRRRCPLDSISSFSGSPETRGEDVTRQMNPEEAVDLHKAKEELLASLESLRRSADGGKVYLLKLRLSKALPKSSAAASLAADVGRLVSELNALKQEKASLMAFRHQTPREIRKEYTQMMLIGLATGLAAAIHPIFFAGTIYGVIRMRRARLAESDRDALTQELEARNEFIQTTTCRMRALAAALEEALRKEFNRPPSHLLRWAAAIGTAVFAASLYHAVFC